jgi:succinate dehydrogenase/fumarate reductase flavoprotein subunit
MEVAPTAHYSMGGVVVDIKCSTKIRGLFAVGEVISQIQYYYLLLFAGEAEAVN